MGSGEILVIALIALVVLGPEKLPKLAADIGRAFDLLRNGPTAEARSAPRRLRGGP